MEIKVFLIKYRYVLLGAAILPVALVYYFLLLSPAKKEYAILEQNNFIIAGDATSSPIIVKRAKPAKRAVRGIYLTAYSGGSAKKVDNIIASIKQSQINAVIIDIKDYSGFLSYDSRLPIVDKYGLREIKIKDLPGVIKKFHDQDIYTIARIAVFQDPALSQKKPDWAVLNKDTGKVWRDYKGLSWLDPANPEVWDYHIDIAKEAIALGFDEINLDYIRFPSDGKMSTMKFPKWTDDSSKAEVIKKFFAYFRAGLKDELAYTSADLFGLTTTIKNDMNIGQVLENAAPYFDYICPMVYPSHYPKGYLKFSNPADHPYEIIYQAVKTARERLATTTDSIAEIRPWIQDFNLGAVYNATMIKKELAASADAGGVGYLVWDPKNVYTWEAYK